jgi:hypothetical protein
MNLPTAIVLLVVLAMVVAAIHFLRMGKGKCSCGENKKSGCSGCSMDCPFRR